MQVIGLRMYSNQNESNKPPCQPQSLNSFLILRSRSIIDGAKKPKVVVVKYLIISRSKSRRVISTPLCSKLVLNWDSDKKGREFLPTYRYLTIQVVIIVKVGRKVYNFIYIAVRIQMKQPNQTVVMFFPLQISRNFEML